MKIKRDPESIQQLREVLATPTLLGGKAHTISDEEIAVYAEDLLDCFAEAAVKIREAFVPIAEAWTDLAKRWAALGRAFEEPVT